MNPPDVRLLHITDTHLFASREGCLRDVPTLPCLQRVLAHASARSFEAVLCTGDLVNDDPGGYVHFRAELGALGRPVYCLPGNHDRLPQLRAALSSPPFQVGGHADLGAWRVILLDSSVVGQAGGRLGTGELQALEHALAETGRFALVCVHHHPVPMGSPWLDAIGIDNAEELFALLDRHAQVRALAWGHVHQCFDGRRRGVRLLATPSTCLQFAPRSNQFAVEQRPPAYRRLTLRGDGTLDSELVWVDEGATAAERLAL